LNRIAEIIIVFLLTCRKPGIQFTVLYSQGVLSMRLRNHAAGLAILLVAIRLAGAENNSESQRPVSGYVLGSGDSIVVRVTEAEEIPDRPIRIDLDGNVDLPLAGSVHAAGLTALQLEQSIAEKLSVLIKAPRVSVSIEETKSQPVSIIGAVNSPGMHQIEGHKTLIEVLSLAGGLRPDAGYRVKITRLTSSAPLPLPDTFEDASHQHVVGEVGLKSLLEARDPMDNVDIMPNDVISVPTAEMVYVIGTVKKSGGYVLGEHQSISVLQALSLAGGLDQAAASQDSRILRTVSGSDNRQELRVDLRKILEGKNPDMPLQASDILFVPVSGAKKAGIRAFDAVMQIGTGLAIYRP
jgi:polysaccharide biosynthesis/export protein